MELLTKIFEASMIVEEKHLASSLGSGNAKVFSTPTMITFVEKTCHDVLIPYLSEGYITVGSKVNIQHLKPTPLGAKVTCKVKLIETNGKTFDFNVEVYDEIELIGQGSHQRCQVNKEKFEAKTNAKLQVK